MLGLVMSGTVLNYLARASLSVEAPTLKTSLAMTTQQYSWVVIAFQGAYAAMQPVAGAILDKLGTRVGLALFAVAWSFATMSHAMARRWPSLALARGLLGASEAAAVPAGLRVISVWFPPTERSMAVGWFSISSIGNVIAPSFVAFCILWQGWRSAFVIIGVISLVWAVLWYIFYRDPDVPVESTLVQAEPVGIGHVDDRAPEIITKRSQLLRSRAFWSIAIPRFLAEPTWQTLNFFIPLFWWRSGTCLSGISRSGLGFRSSAPISASYSLGIYRPSLSAGGKYRSFSQERSSRRLARSE